MNSRTTVVLLCGLAFRLISVESLSETSNRTISEPDLHCAFEGDLLCNWREVSETDPVKWKTYSKGEYHSTGPQKDHTTGHGHFLSIRTSYRDEAGNAILESPPIITDHETCLSFWYFMYGNSVDYLNVYRIGEGDVKNKTFSMFGQQGERWYRAVVNTGDGSFKLQIEATSVGKRDYGAIAVDDIAFSYHACQEDDSTLLKDQPRFDCDFEDDWCGWFVSYQQTLKWRMKDVSVDSNDRNALPPGSSGTSYVEAVTTSRGGYSHETMLQGPIISVDSSAACLSFWYKIDGPAIRTFRVKMSEHGKSLIYGGKTQFSTSVNSIPTWMQGLVSLPEVQNVYIAFEVRSRREEGGSLGLDDIRLTRGGPCVRDSESMINCDFEKDFCRWFMKSKKNEGDWLRTKDPTPTNSTGPSHDHTTGEGYYIFLDASDVQQARLYSIPFFVNSSGACLSFWYYMHGADVNTLELRSSSSSYFYTGVDWSIKGPQGDQWIQQHISLNGGVEVSLVFTATRGYFPRGDIALDDISITFEGPCGNDNDKETIVPSTFHPEVTGVEWSITELPEVAVNTTTATTTTEPPPSETPKLLVKGKIDPAYNNSRVELVCQHSEQRGWIRWYRRASNVYYIEKQKVEEKHGDILLFEEIRPEDEGFYSCAVRNYYRPQGNDSNEVHITVVPDPRPSPVLQIDGKADDVSHGNPFDVLVDATVKLVCGVEINGGEYHWKTTSHAFNSYNLPKDRVLILNTTEAKHSGVYSCRISKDEFMTAKSNELNINVRPGKRCEYDWRCYGDAYYRNCVNNRCECHRDAVLHGRQCQMRPKTPKISTSPSFLEFGIGESFYLVCEADEPAPANLTYTLKRLYTRHMESPLSILKVTNATEGDTGSYSCHVTHNGIDSRGSKSISIQIKDFIDLNCDFEKDVCEWFQDNETDTADFVSFSSDGYGQESAPDGPFIRLDASNSMVPNKALLLSPTIDRMALDSCLTFWYRMHGPDVHSLSLWRYVYSKDSNDFGGSKLWTVIGEKGDVWFKQKVTVGNGTKFYVAFDAIGQVDIDDITFTYRGSC